MSVRTLHYSFGRSLTLASLLTTATMVDTGCGGDPGAGTDGASTQNSSSTTDSDGNATLTSPTTPTETATTAPTSGSGITTPGETTEAVTTTTTTTEGTTTTTTEGTTTSAGSTTTTTSAGSTTTTTSEDTTAAATDTDTTGAPVCVRWEQTYGGAATDFGTNIVHISGGGFAIAGRIASKGAGGDDMWLLRLDEEGALLWERTYGTAGSESANGLALAPDGGFLLVGTRYSQATSLDWWIVRTDSEGIALWDKTFSTMDADHAFTAVAVQAGGFAVAGVRDRIAMGTGRFWLIRLADDGSVLWEKIYGDLGSEQLAYGLVEFPGDGFALAGTAADDFWLVRTDVDGNLLWDRSYDFGGGHHDRATSLVRMPDDGLGLAGWTSSDQSSDYWIVRTDADGEALWTNHYDRAHSDLAEDVAVLADGGLVVVGSSQSDGDGDLWIVRTDPAGAVVWERSYGGTEYDGGYGVVALPDADLAFVGRNSSMGAGADDAWVLRTGPEGQLTCE